jgi:hypothetical protein
MQATCKLRCATCFAVLWHGLLRFLGLPAGASSSDGAALPGLLPPPFFAAAFASFAAAFAASAASFFALLIFARTSFTWAVER